MIKKNHYYDKTIIIKIKNHYYDKKSSPGAKESLLLTLGGKSGRTRGKAPSIT